MALMGLPEYHKWVAGYLERHNGGVLGKCQPAVAEMREEFPELTEVRGHIYTTWGKRGHIWCTTPDGEIVDPTAAQFPVIFEYEPWVPGTDVLVGTCMNCGDEIWRPMESLDDDPPLTSICSTDCSDALHAEYNPGGKYYPRRQAR